MWSGLKLQAESLSFELSYYGVTLSHEKKLVWNFLLSVIMIVDVKKVERVAKPTFTWIQINILPWNTIVQLPD